MALTAVVEPDSRNVRLDYTVPAGGATVTFARVGASGVPAVVRSWNRKAVVAGPVIARDFEVPIGVALTYTAQTYNSSGTVTDTQTTTITIASHGCSDTWLNDLARVVNTMQVTIETLPELAYPAPATVHDVITRRDPIVATDIAHTPSFELSVLTDTLDDRDVTRAILGNGIPVLLRTPPEDGIGNLYFSVVAFAEQRIVAPAVAAVRRFVISARQVTRPDPALFTPLGPAIYSYVKQTFATYAVLKSQRVNYDALLYDWTGAQPSDVVPWPPTDV